MLATDEEAVICDLAETYHIYDYRSFPVKYIATLCAGLRSDSRIFSKINGIKRHISQEFLLAVLVDNLKIVRNLLMKDPPKHEEYYSDMMLTEKKKEQKYKVFDSPEAFEAEWERLTGVKRCQT